MPVGLFDEKEAWVFDQQVFIDEKPSFYSFGERNEKSDGGRGISRNIQRRQNERRSSISMIEGQVLQSHIIKMVRVKNLALRMQKAATCLSYLE